MNDQRVERIKDAVVKRGQDAPKRRRPMTPVEIYEQLGDIAVRLGWLKPSSTKPEQYHEDKSELLRDIGKLREAVRLGVLE